MIGGPSIIFTRYHEAGKSSIMSHKYQDSKICASVVGFDLNSLYLYCSWQEMPCSKEEYVEVSDSQDAGVIKKLCDKVMKDQLFEFLQVDIHNPDQLLEKFSEFPPLFIVDSVPKEQIPKHMKEYQERTGRKTVSEIRTPLGLTRVKGLLLYMPMLKLYLSHGLKVNTIYKYLKYEASKPF